MKPSTEASPAAGGGKPRFAYSVATALGVGYLKPGPGTWGSVAGLIIAVVSHPYSWFVFLGKGIQLGMGTRAHLLSGHLGALVLLVPSVAVWFVLSYLGVRCSTHVAEFAGVKDPQYVVIDEVSGVHLALMLGLAPVTNPWMFFHVSDAGMFAIYSGMSLLNWQYLLAGFVLFRIFDIVKPPPIRYFDKNWHGGLGVMFDDLLAAGYALLCLAAIRRVLS